MSRPNVILSIKSSFAKLPFLHPERNNSMWSINVDGKILQWITFKISETSHFSTERALQKSLRTLLSFPGWTQIYYSPNINHQSILHIYISWESGAELDAFTSSNPWPGMFSKLAVSPVYSYHIDLKGSISPNLPTEMVSFIFQAPVTEMEKTEFIHNINQFVSQKTESPGNARGNAGIASAQGWIYPYYAEPEQRQSIEHGYIVFMAPSGLELNSDMDSLWNSAIAPLNGGRGVVINKALYLGLESKTRDDLGKKCVVM